MDTRGIKVTREASARERAALTRCVREGLSFQALHLLQEKRVLEVCQSGAGHYLGCIAGVEEEIPFEPVCRDSEYFESAERARAALKLTAWTQRLDP